MICKKASQSWRWQCMAGDDCYASNAASYDLPTNIFGQSLWVPLYQACFSPSEGEKLLFRLLASRCFWCILLGPWCLILAWQRTWVPVAVWLEACWEGRIGLCPDWGGDTRGGKCLAWGKPGPGGSVWLCCAQGTFPVWLTGFATGGSSLVVLSDSCNCEMLPALSCHAKVDWLELCWDQCSAPTSQAKILPFGGESGREEPETLIRQVYNSSREWRWFKSWCAAATKICGCLQQKMSSSVSLLIETM